MCPSVTCYPTPGKEKSRLLLEAFAAGGEGRVETSGQLQPGPAAFYGVVEATLPLWQQACAEGRDWYYLDNAYFDVTRGRHFRVTKGRLQARGDERPDWTRLAALALGVQPWRKGGKHIVVCPQSAWFMQLCSWAGGAEGWLHQVLTELKAHTDRPIIVRHWKRDKAAAAADLAEDLKGAWALVTHMSAAANEALVAGVPVFTTGKCAATWLGSSELFNIEKPRRPDGRMAWAAALAGQQWTLDELRDGTAWKVLHGLG